MTDCNPGIVTKLASWCGIYGLLHIDVILIVEWMGVKRCSFLRLGAWDSWKMDRVL